MTNKKTAQKTANARRQAEFKARHLMSGKVRRGYYATQEQHEKIKELLISLQAENESTS